MNDQDKLKFKQMLIEQQDKLIYQYRMALELIAVGNIKNPVEFSKQVLVDSGFWSGTK